MQSPPGSLLVLGWANIYHSTLSTDLWYDSNPWRTRNNLFDTLAPVGLMESAVVSMESDGGGPCSVQNDKNIRFTRNQRTAQRTICESPFSSIHCLLMFTTRTSCNLQGCDCSHL